MRRALRILTNRYVVSGLLAGAISSGLDLAGLQLPLWWYFLLGIGFAMVWPRGGKA